MHTASNRFCFVAQPGPRENITQLAHSWEKLPRYKAFAAILQVITCHENSKQLDGKSKERTASVTVFLLESQFLRQKRAKTLALMHAVYSLGICGDLLMGDSTECSTKIGIGFSPFALALLERTKCSELRAFREECLAAKHSALTHPQRKWGVKWICELEGQFQSKKGPTQSKSDPKKSIAKSLKRGENMEPIIQAVSLESWDFGCRRSSSCGGAFDWSGKHCLRLAKRTGTDLSEWRNIELRFAVSIDNFRACRWLPSIPQTLPLSYPTL